MPGTWRPEQLRRFSINLSEERSDSDYVVLPQLMHSEIHRWGLDPARVAGLRAAERRIRIFWAGHCNESYDANPAYARCGTLSRWRLDQSLRRYAARRPERVVFTGRHVDRHLGLDEADALLRRPGGAGPERNAFYHLAERVNQRVWLEFLSRADFFLCPPGLDFATNQLAECMSVGTIPLTNVGDIQAPPLRHLEECVSFRDEPGFFSALDLILDMDAARVERLRRGVIDYYERNIAPRGLREKLDRALRGSFTLYYFSDSPKFSHCIKPSSVAFRPL